jgi:predicted 3-demethylubiquinone-9 3-methyltransferase (glyoxalase superfamily)
MPEPARKLCCKSLFKLKIYQLLYSLILVSFENTNNKHLMSNSNDQVASIQVSQQITPFLWFDGRVEEAIELYTSVFPNSHVLNINRLPAEVPGHNGKIITAAFILNGVEFMILDGGPQFKLNGSVSFFVKCETQEEVDHLWNSLTADGGKESRCGWLKDKFGVSWQIVPNVLGRLMGAPDRARAQNVMQAMMKMAKLDIAGLQAAYDK